MRKREKTARVQDQMPTTATGHQMMTTALKWVGSLTAILSLVFGLHQLADFVSSNRKQHRHLAELLDTSRTQVQAGDFHAAWKTLEEADRYVQEDAKVQAARADLAMHWLETRFHPDPRFFDASTILPVVERAVSTAKGKRKADLLAHAGWAEFLRSDDGGRERESLEYYHQALQIDPQNVYARAMHGYCSLQCVLDHGEGPEDARKEFQLALAGGREHDYVRRLQLAALGGHHKSETDIEFMRTLNDMRENDERVSPETQNVILGFYSDRLNPTIVISDRPTVVVDSQELQSLLSAVPTADQFAIFSWLFDRPGLKPSKVYIREYYRAVLQEGSGRRSEALGTLLKARPSVPSDDPVFERAFEEAISRLSKKS